MIYGTLALSVLIPAAAFVMEARRMPPYRIVLSPFWYFTFVFLAAFPLRAWLLHGGYVQAQVVVSKAMPPLTGSQVDAALLLSLGFWVLVFLGYRSVRERSAAVVGPMPQDDDVGGNVERRALVVLLVLGVVAAAAILYLNPSARILDGERYMAARAGHAILWIMPELPLYGVIGVAAVLAARRGTGITVVVAAVLALVLIEMFWISNMLLTRRVVAAVCLTLVLMVVRRRPDLWLLGFAGVVGTVFAAPIFEEIRRIRAQLAIAKPSEDSVSVILKHLRTDHHLNLLSTSFEGVEHVSRFLSKATWPQLMTGVDHGVSWLFNLGLSFVPRAVWAGKPMVYGGTEQFRWLYPSYFANGLGSTAIPTSFVVDLSFGFGIVFGLALAFVLGRFLAACGNALWARNASPAAVAIALCTFVFTFNTVRGGTALAQSLVVMGAIGVLMFGVRPMLAGLVEILTATIGPWRRREAADG